MPQPITPDDTQQFLLPPSVEEWVPADHPARFIREFVEQLDLRELGFKLPACSDGRPPVKYRWLETSSAFGSSKVDARCA